MSRRTPSCTRRVATGAGHEGRPQLHGRPLDGAAGSGPRELRRWRRRPTRRPSGEEHAHYPSFLPKKTLDPAVDAALTGTEAKPALQVEGLPIEAKTSAFHVRVTVSGPIVPGEGLPNQQAATTCTWTVTMKDATADVPVSVADFHSVDHLGSVFIMGLVPGEHAPPSVLHRGQALTFQLRSYELVGEGMMQWAPDHTHVVGDWDYTVEND